ncbi:MAG: ATP-binding protein, partial [Bacteroidota bacterium]
MTHFFHSMRTRLTLWYSALLAATLLAFGATASLFTRSVLSNNLDLSLRNEVEWVNEFIEPQAKKVRLSRAARKELQQLRQTAQREVPKDLAAEEAQIDALWNQIYQHTLLNPRKQFIQILDRNGDLLYSSPNLGQEHLTFSRIPFRTVDVVTTTMTDGKDIRLAVSQNDYVKIFVGYPLQELNEVLGNLFSTFLILSPLALLISGIGGWFLAHQSLKPVDTITRTAREISLQNLAQRLPVRSVDDEIGRLTATFNDMIGRLESSFTQIQQFSADASHELRTPLTIMRGEIEVALRNTSLGPATRKLLKSTRDELVRLSSIVDSLMTLVKSDAGRFTFRFETIELDRMLREIGQDATVLGEGKNIQVRFDNLDPIMVEGDSLRLRQLFLNLVENAVKYTPRHGRIAISAARENGEAVVTVRDNGIGIPARDLEKIFERFYRVERPGHQAVEGNGLGLAIAKWIAEAHHGSVGVKSRLRSGSTFTVRLPLTFHP